METRDREKNYTHTIREMNKFLIKFTENIVFDHFLLVVNHQFYVTECSLIIEKLESRSYLKI